MWMAILLTATVLPILVWVFENLYLTGSLPYGEHLIQTWVTSIHLSFAQLFVLDVSEDAA